VCVVELDGDLVGQRGPVVTEPAESTEDVRERAGDEEVLLGEAQEAAASVESSG
jgi:hypothetical protein